MMDLKDKNHLLLVLLSFLLLAGQIFVSSGLFIIDEFVLVATATSLANGQGLVFGNGYETFHSESLRLWLFVPGVRGLVAQYPPGMSLVGAMTWGLLGERGMILANSLAAVGTLWATYGLALTLTRDRTVSMGAVLVLLFGSFWLEYAYGIWPHSISVFLTTAGCLAVARSIEAREESAKLLWLAGLLIGLGMLFRVDSILALPPLAAYLWLYASAPVRAVARLVSGLLPGCVALALCNYLKFGQLQPISYGQSSGLTSIQAHMTTLGLFAVVAMLVLYWRAIVDRGLAVRYAVVPLCLLVVAVVVVAPLREAALAYLQGARQILVDAGSIQDPRPGVFRGSDGILYFWGFVKKALGQSLPWLGCLLLWIKGPHTQQQRRMLSLLGLFALLWATPFIASAWHGGLGSNMRYLLPLLPLLSIAGVGACLRDVGGSRPGGSVLVGGVLAGVVLVFLWSAFVSSGLPGGQQILATGAFILITLSAVVTVLLSGWCLEKARHVTLFFVAAGLGMAACFGALDLRASQHKRDFNQQVSAALATVPEYSLIYGPPEVATFALERSHTYLALTPSVVDNRFDLVLATKALQAGYGVYAPPSVVEALARQVPGLEPGPAFHSAANGGLLELRLRVPERAHAE